jgi:hypothetical protein
MKKKYLIKIDMKNVETLQGFLINNKGPFIKIYNNNDEIYFIYHSNKFK